MSKSLEALEELCSKCYVECEKSFCHARYKGGKCSTFCEYKEQIKKDLERLEVLEEIHKDDKEQIKELRNQLSIYKSNYYELDEAIIELIDKFKVVRGSDKR